MLRLVLMPQLHLMIVQTNEKDQRMVMMMCRRKMDRRWRVYACLWVWMTNMLVWSETGNGCSMCFLSDSAIEKKKEDMLVKKRRKTIITILQIITGHLFLPFKKVLTWCFAILTSDSYFVGFCCPVQLMCAIPSIPWFSTAPCWI